MCSSLGEDYFPTQHSLVACSSLCTVAASCPFPICFSVFIDVILQQSGLVCVAETLSFLTVTGDTISHSSGSYNFPTPSSAMIREPCLVWRNWVVGLSAETGFHNSALWLAVIFCSDFLSSFAKRGFQQRLRMTRTCKNKDLENSRDNAGSVK